MTFELIEKDNNKIFRISSENILLSNEDSALDIIGNSKYQEVYKVIIDETNIDPDFLI